MKKLPMIGLVPVFLTAFLLSAPPLRAQEHPHSEHMMKCARACADCQLECDSCFAHCRALLGEGKKEHAKTAQTCSDCADVCSLAAKLSARGSPYAGSICDACAKTCDDCAAACEKFPDDQHMKKCATTCRACAKACREMVEHLKG
jgi:hypothetical protein